MCEALPLYFCILMLPAGVLAGKEVLSRLSNDSRINIVQL